jgi:hypothetical protein
MPIELVEPTAKYPPSEVWIACSKPSLLAPPNSSITNTATATGRDTDTGTGTSIVCGIKANDIDLSPASNSVSTSNPLVIDNIENILKKDNFDEKTVNIDSFETPETIKSRNNTINLRVKIINPRLLILDDPSSRETSSILCRSEIDIHYSRDMCISSQKTLDESLHLTLHQFELLLIPNILCWFPKRIVEPISAEFHLRRKCIDDSPVFTKISVDTDSLVSRVSLQEFYVIESILNHHPPTQSKGNYVPIDSTNSTSTKAQHDNTVDIKTIVNSL